MTDAAKKLYEQALQLRPKERQWLADELLDQLDTEPVTDEELAASSEDPDFIAMVEQRIAEHDANPEDAMPADEAIANIRAELGRRAAWRSR